MRDTSMRSSVARSETLRRALAVSERSSRTEAGDRRALDRAQVVDDALGVALVRARLGVVRAREVRDGEQPAVEALDGVSPRASSSSLPCGMPS
jgi:hypothetical protein